MKRSGRSISYPDKIADGIVVARHIADGAVTRAKIPATFIQAGRATVTLPFAAVGAETVSASITFPEAFPAGVDYSTGQAAVISWVAIAG